jgi:hypothetical protein
VVVSTSAVPKSEAAGIETASALVTAAKARLPYPDDVLDCVARRANGDPKLSAALKASDKAANLAAIDRSEAACVIEVRTAPRFAEDLQRDAGGTLTEEQLACATKEFGQLSPEQVEAAAGAVRYRHCLWAGILVWGLGEYGDNGARGFLNRHEGNQPIAENGYLTDSGIDRQNNEIGYSIGRTLTGLQGYAKNSCKSGCLTAFYDGRLLR